MWVRFGLVVGLGQAEVGHPDGAAGVQQQVRRLDVAVEDALLVGVLQRLGHLHADLGHALPVGRPTCPALASPLPLPGKTTDDERRSPTAGRSSMRQSGSRRRLGRRRPADRRSPRSAVGGSVRRIGLRARTGRSSSERATSAAETSRREIRRPARREGSRSASLPPVGAEPLQLLEHLVQPEPEDELHDVVGRALVLAHAEDRHDVGVVQLRRRPRLALEPAPLPRRRRSSAGGRTFSATCRPSETCSAS